MITHFSLNDSKCNLTVLHAQINIPSKILTYPTHSDYYSLGIKFNILSLSKFYLFSIGLFLSSNDRCLYHVSFVLCVILT